MADPPGPDSSLRPPSSPMGDDHDRLSDRVDQEPGGAQVIPGGDQPDPPRPEIETDTGVRARPDIDGDDSSTSTGSHPPPRPRPNAAPCWPIRQRSWSREHRASCGERMRDPSGPRALVSASSAALRSARRASAAFKRGAPEAPSRGDAHAGFFSFSGEASPNSS
jgi:hypothetical protein